MMGTEYDLGAMGNTRARGRQRQGGANPDVLPAA